MGKIGWLYFTVHKNDAMINIECHSPRPYMMLIIMYAIYTLFNFLKTFALL